MNGGSLKTTARRALSSGHVVWVLAAGVATVLALASTWHSASPTWARLDADYRTFSGYSSIQRQEAPVTAAGFTDDIFDFMASNLLLGDRIYFQVPRTAYGTFNLHDTVANLGDFYLLPAVRVTDLRQATVVISYYADPRLLDQHFLTQIRFGPMVVSRLAYP